MKAVKKSILALILAAAVLALTACGTPKTPLTTEHFTE